MKDEDQPMAVVREPALSQSQEWMSDCRGGRETLFIDPDPVGPDQVGDIRKAGTCIDGNGL